MSQVPKLDPRFVRDVIVDCRDYAQRYSCSMLDALYDWEGDGPKGCWGLSPAEIEVFQAMPEFTNG